MSHKILKATSLALLAAGLLAACGGGGSSTVTPPTATANSVPDSALVSSAAYEQYTASLVQTSSETAQPLAAGNLTIAPSSETDQPVPLS